MSNEAPERIAIDDTSEDENGIYLASEPGKYLNMDAPYIREDLHTAEVQRLQDRVRELEGALEPFAEAADECDDYRHDDANQAPVDAGQCRSARAALNKEGSE